MEGNNENKTRAVLYCRVSTEEQREGHTIQSQIAELERFANTKQWSVTDIYQDDGWSGAILARPALDRLRDDASRGQFDLVLLNDVDRLARDVTHLGVIKRDLERHGVRVIFRKLPGEQSPTHNLLVNILGSFAEFEKELISDRTRRGRRHKVEVRKQFLGSIPPYGYEYVSRAQSSSGEGILRINPEEGGVVHTMYRWVSDEGLSAQRVVRRLNEGNLKPRKGGSRWAKSSVLRILRTEIYAGTWYYNKHQLCEPRRKTTHGYRRSLRTSSRLRPRADWIPVELPENLTRCLATSSRKVGSKCRVFQKEREAYLPFGWSCEMWRLQCCLRG
jgi:site-specific DNA recombinase